MKHPTNSSLILTGEDMQQIVLNRGLNAIMDDLITRMETAIINFDPSETEIPIRSGFNYEKPYPGLIEWMPLHKKGGKILIKIVGYHPNNPIMSGLPTILSTFSLYDTTTGHLMGITDGVFLTALRTGAASALASKVLAHPDSKVLGMIGCGAQAVTQLHALSRVFDFEKILIYDVDPAAAESLVTRTEILGLDVEFEVAEIEEIVKESDILVTATSIDVGKGPLFSGLATKPHLHVNAVGSDFPGKIEVPLDLLEKSFVCPDFIGQAVIEGECQQLTKEQIGPDFAEVVKSQDKFKNVQQELSVFDSTGWTLEDSVVMELFLEYAAKLGLGKAVDIEFVPKDAKNPYEFLGAMASVLQTQGK
ncbi:MAG: ornithine cyclodeaminase family protein [Bacteroidota bacterium]